MSRRVRVRPSKSQSFVGMIGGAIFVIIGFSLMPMMGMFGIIWTLFAVAICGLNAYNFFSTRGLAAWEIDTDSAANSDGHFEERLRKLNKLKEDGLITDYEFEKKRTEIMNSKW